MKATKVLTMIDDIIKRIERSEILDDNSSVKMVTQLINLKATYQEVDVKEENTNIYEALRQKGEWLKSQFSSQNDPKRLSKDINYYIKLLRASIADFSGDSVKLVNFHRLFFSMCILFLVLAPQWYGPLITILTLIPIITAMKGIRDRRKSGLMLSAIIGPISLMTGLNCIKMGLEVMKDFSGQLQMAMEILGKGEMLATISITVIPLVGTLLFVLSVITMIKAFNLKDMFV